MAPSRLRAGLGLALILALSGCVSQGAYDKAVQDAQDVRARAARDAEEAARRDAAAKAEIDRLSRELDGATAEDAQLRKELAALGKNVDEMLAEKGTLSASLAQTKARLEELRRAQAAAEGRAALFRELALKFQKMIDAGDLRIGLRDGRMVLQLSTDVLFDTGRTEIKPVGRAALTQIATILQTIGGRDFQIAGHTDTVPIHNERFASNWELSTARALEVMRFVVAHGMKPQALSAAGYGEFDPVASNDTPAGRAQNRRIEITLQPNIEELVTVPENGR